ncbi:hypothetical protein [Virgibacillus oceani]|uniref:Uncharacterized protein n=1 Tax=Virgibacillus oceani TaxID=1479511 RepID=A0A917HA87_9BACI|nr:hypothetical protein [Virgibacillus oceani]GGG72327.1 hypothetical protein GCM10011398_15850 [Virgibacillus oceani]
MEAYTYTKIIGVIAGTLLFAVAIGVGFLALVGMGLSTAFGTVDYSTTYQVTAIIILVLMLIGLITAIGAFKLNHSTWKKVYIGFCFTVEIGFAVVFIISFGGIGFISELFILGVGIIYLLLGFVTKINN